MKDGRYTIGFLTQFSSSSDGFQNLVWKSMVEAARKHNVNGLFFAGGQIDNAPYNPFEKNLNVVYDLIKRDNPDGLVIRNIITVFISTERLREFCLNFGLPAVIFLGAVGGHRNHRRYFSPGQHPGYQHLDRFDNYSFYK